MGTQSQSTRYAAENSMLNSSLNDLVSGLGVQRPVSMATMKMQQHHDISAYSLGGGMDATTTAKTTPSQCHSSFPAAPPLSPSKNLPHQPSSPPMAVHARPHTLTSPPPAVSMQQGARQGGMSTSLDALAFGSLSSFSLTGASPSQMRNGNAPMRATPSKSSSPTEVKNPSASKGPSQQATHMACSSFGRPPTTPTSGPVRATNTEAERTSFASGQSQSVSDPYAMGAGYRSLAAQNRSQTSRKAPSAAQHRRSTSIDSLENLVDLKMVLDGKSSGGSRDKRGLDPIGSSMRANHTIAHAPSSRINTASEQAAGEGTEGLDIFDACILSSENTGTTVAGHGTACPSMKSEATSTTDLNALDSFLSATACHSSAPTSNMCQPCESNPTHRSPEYGLGLVAEKQPQQPDTHSRSSGEQPPLTPNGLDALSGFLSGGSAQPQGDVANESTLEELDLEGAGGKSIACGGTTQSRDATEAYGIDGLDGFFSTATTRSSLDKGSYAAGLSESDNSFDNFLSSMTQPAQSTSTPALDDVFGPAPAAAFPCHPQPPHHPQSDDALSNLMASVGQMNPSQYHHAQAQPQEEVETLGVFWDDNPTHRRTSSSVGGLYDEETESGVEGEPELRAELRRKRLAERRVRIEQSLVDQRARERAEAVQRDERERAAEKHGDHLKAWIKRNKGNVRAQLSSLDEVLWEGNTWKPVKMMDLISPASVKKAYRKALLLVHADKMTKETDVSKKYIADLLFDALRDAWNIFEANENP